MAPSSVVQAPPPWSWSAVNTGAPGSAGDGAESLSFRATQKIKSLQHPGFRTHWKTCFHTQSSKLLTRSFFFKTHTLKNSHISLYKKCNRHRLSPFLLRFLSINSSFVPPNHLRREVPLLSPCSGRGNRVRFAQGSTTSQQPGRDCSCLKTFQ